MFNHTVHLKYFVVNVFFSLKDVLYSYLCINAQGKNYAWTVLVNFVISVFFWLTCLLLTQGQVAGQTRNQYIHPPKFHHSTCTAVKILNDKNNESFICISFENFSSPKKPTCDFLTVFLHKIHQKIFRLY